MVSKTIILSSTQSSVELLEDYLKEVINEFKVCESKFPDILISLTEAVNNAIIHGNKYDINKKVQVQCQTKRNGIYFSVIDEGNGFDPKSIPNPTTKDRIECCGGRGVFIINSLADKVAYKDNGSRLEMYFNE